MIDDLLTPSGPPASDEVRERIFRRTLPLLPWRRPIVALLVLVGAVAAGLMLLVPRTPDAGPPPPRAVVNPAPEGDTARYRAAADRYLDEGSPDEATRCYGHALDAGTAADLELQPEDSFLLMAIKHARKREGRE